LTLSEVARETGLARAVARRFLLTLQDLGYVRADDRRFGLTPRVLELGYSFLSSLTLPEIAQPHLRDLVGRVHESTSPRRSVCSTAPTSSTWREPTRRIMTVHIAVGTRFPAYATSMGRVLLAGLQPDDLAEFLAGCDLRALTSSTLIDVEVLTAEIGRVRARGFALVDQELEAGLRSIAVPIRDARGRVQAAVNLSAHASRTTVEVLREELLPQLQQTAAAIERDLAAGRR
jgi:IclR family pca regulon transcriptional regulator